MPKVYKSKGTNIDIFLSKWKVDPILNYQQPNPRELPKIISLYLILRILEWIFRVVEGLCVIYLINISDSNHPI